MNITDFPLIAAPHSPMHTDGSLNLATVPDQARHRGDGLAKGRQAGEAQAPAGSLCHVQTFAGRHSFAGHTRELTPPLFFAALSAGGHRAQLDQVPAVHHLCGHPRRT